MFKNVFLVLNLIVLISIMTSQKETEKTFSKQMSIPSVASSALLPIFPHYYRDPDIEDLLEEIVKRESGGNPNVCNKEFGCKAGMGLVQLIPTTVKYCEEKLGRDIDPFDPEDNLACGYWLLANEGIRHWETWSGPYDNL